MGAVVVMTSSTIPSVSPETAGPGPQVSSGCDKVSGVFWSVAATFGGSHCPLCPVCPLTKCDMSRGTEVMCLVSGPARSVDPEKCGPGKECGETASEEEQEDTSGEESLTGEKGDP